MTTVVVSSVIANKYLNGGNAWVILSWLRGFERLGCDVYFVEQLKQGNCVDSMGHAAAFEASVNLSYFKRIVEEFGLDVIEAAGSISEQQRVVRQLVSQHLGRVDERHISVGCQV